MKRRAAVFFLVVAGAGCSESSSTMSDDLAAGGADLGRVDASASNGADFAGAGDASAGADLMQGPDLAFPKPCADQVKNGSETDVDCGGKDCRPCVLGKACGVNADCESALCTNGICSALCPGFAAKAEYATDTAPLLLGMGDLDGDGKLNLLTANPGAMGTNHTVSVLLNKGAGAFGAKADYTTGTDPTWVAVQDVDGDSEADLIVSNQGENTVSVLINKGGGVFAAKVDYGSGNIPSAVSSADLNGDGMADLAVTNQADSTVSVLLNKGGGVFAAKVDYPTGSGPYSLALGDLDGDKQTDVVVTNIDNMNFGMGKTVSVLLNKGAGVLSAKVDYVVGLAPHFVAIGNLDGDAHPDLAVANSRDGTVSVLLNLGKGTFAAKVDYGKGFDGDGVGIGDFNNDGLPDLAAPSTTSVSVLVNKGGGAFAAQLDFPTGKGSGSVVVGDFNSDGKPDIAKCDQSDGRVSVLLNSCM